MKIDATIRPEINEMLNQDLAEGLVKITLGLVSISLDSLEITTSYATLQSFDRAVRISCTTRESENDAIDYPNWVFERVDPEHGYANQIQLAVKGPLRSFESRSELEQGDTDLVRYTSELIFNTSGSKSFRIKPKQGCFEVLLLSRVAEK